MRRRVLRITKVRFLTFYFEYGQDSENEEIRLNLANRVINSLFKDGTSVVTVLDIFNECNHDAIRCGYIEGFDVDDERELGQLEYDYELELI